MKLKERIYFRSPLVVQQLLTVLQGYLFYKQRYGPVYEQRFNELIEKEGRTVDVAAEQLESLNEFLAFCKEHSDYYKELFDTHQITLPLPDLDALKNIPILEKETLRAENERVHTDIHAPLLAKTGGTTGTSLHVHYTKEDMQRGMAHLDYFKYKHGVRKGMRRASFTGQVLISKGQKKPVYWRMNPSLNQLLFTIKQISPRTIPYYIARLNEFKPESIDGMPSGMIEVARYAKRHGIRLTIRPRAIFPTAEMITAEERALLEEVYHAPVFDQYASSEGAPIVAECPYRRKHLHYEMGIIEVIEEGEILVTSFDTHGTPLVRYRIGDRMTMSKETFCPCGHPGPIVESIDGRGRSFLLMEDGHKVFEGELAGIVRILPNCIERVQYIQERQKEVTFLYVPDQSRFKPEHEKQLHFVLRRLFGPEMKINAHPVEVIPQEASGKTLLIKQKIPHEKARAN
ncbi:phenylacetate--CoA ligase family protein [Exiguobacterium flavidum]|uniref:phenylacetate--CoA ligase family protein n=1 Tax=Exiguobacterium flavidum TaxID=2184695 RepID=UPI000DF76CB3|nr:phenylacetate--CoA ligase family protein [Exiguobacterium flavidum]